MPDNRTVYSTDDGTNGVLLMFKADNPGDLSSGEAHLTHLQLCTQAQRLGSL
jgi:hypothetical protein